MDIYNSLFLPFLLTYLLTFFSYHRIIFVFLVFIFLLRPSWLYLFLSFPFFTSRSCRENCIELSFSLSLSRNVSGKTSNKNQFRYSSRAIQSVKHIAPIHPPPPPPFLFSPSLFSLRYPLPPVT